MEQRNPPRALPTGLIPGFARVAGVPNTSNTKSYFASAADAISRCAADPNCVGVSAQRMFFREDVGSSGGGASRIAIIKGRQGEDAAYVKH
jgi:hypothetical protein